MEAIGIAQSSKTFLLYLRQGSRLEDVEDGQLRLASRQDPVTQLDRDQRVRSRLSTGTLKIAVNRAAKASGDLFFDLGPTGLLAAADDLREQRCRVERLGFP